MTEFIGWDEAIDYEGDEEEYTESEELVYWKKPTYVGDALLGDMVKYHQAREEFIQRKARAAELCNQRYKQIIDGCRQMKKNLQSIPPPKIPEVLQKAPQIRTPREKKPQPFGGKRPETSMQFIGYMAAKPECKLRLFGTERVKPMHSCRQLLGFEYVQQR